MKYKIVEHGEIVDVFWVGKFEDSKLPAVTDEYHTFRKDEYWGKDIVIYDGIGNYPSWDMLCEYRRLLTPLEQLL